MKYIIYLTTNLKSQINRQNRIYLGVHKIENPDIFDGYLGDGVYISKASTFMYPKTPFQYAVKKYGSESFLRTILYTYDNKEDAYKKLSELLDNNLLNQTHVYNSLAIINSKPIYQFDLDGNLLNTWETITEASDFYGYGDYRFVLAITHKVQLLNYYWSYDKSIDITKYKNSNQNIIYLYSKSGKLVKCFLSKIECADYFNCNVNVINNAIINQVLTNDFYITNKIVDIFEPRPSTQLKRQIMYLYNKDNEYLGQFKGKEIMKAINMHSFIKISNALNLNKGWYKNFYISLTKIDKVPEKSESKRRIDIYTQDGHFIETLENVKDVKEKYNLTSSEINKILKGVKYHDKYIFKYSSK